MECPKATRPKLALSKYFEEKLAMKMDVIGRARNVQLPISKPLSPLFETIMNSIQAIEDANIKNGKIEIDVVKNTEPLLLPEEHGVVDITGFVVKDNGIGFDENNYEAFLTSDTTYKVERGGRGIGRFLWLAAFDRVEIESYFGITGRIKKRSFKFCLSEKGVENHSCVDKNDSLRGTTVRLMDFKDKYAQNCPKRLDSIATQIVEQFLDIFIAGTRLEIILHDSLTNEVINLYDFYEKLAASIETKKIHIKGKEFNLSFIRLYSTHINDHKVNLCANDRVVKSEKLSGIPNLTKRLQDTSGKEFVCAVYVNSVILDEAVNQERADFNLLKDDETLFDKEISISDIWQGVREACKSYLKPYTDPIAQLKQDRIETFIANEGAMYRPILKHLRPKIDEISPEANDAEIDKHLYDGYHELQVRLRSEGQSLLQEAGKITDENFESYKQRFDDYFEKITEANKADLARYVCNRKAIIEFLKNQLSLQVDEKYNKEDQIHDIIFPRGRTSEDVFFNDHNLWLIDERLAFHTYLASDQSLKLAKPLQNKSKKEPDILVFDKAIAFSETDSIPFNSIIIIEFKRPSREEYSEKENPFTQIINYIREIKAGKAKTPDGRLLPVQENLPFYCYIVCDLTPKLKEWAVNHACKLTPDGTGYFMFHPNFNAYIEVISYGKLVSDAEKRNKAFFNIIGF